MICIAYDCYLCIELVLWINGAIDHQVDDLRGTPMAVGTLEELIDDNHAIVASSMGPEYYVTIMSFVNQDLLEAGSTVLLHNKVCVV